MLKSRERKYYHAPIDQTISYRTSHRRRYGLQRLWRRCARQLHGPDAFIGIVGGNPGSSVGGIPYNRGIYLGDGYRANTGHSYQHGYGGYGTYNGGYYHGY